jgi:amino acid permease
MSEIITLLNNKPQRGATILSGIFNIVNTIIGGGALALPFVMKESGVAWGIVLVFIVGGLSIYSQRLIVTTSQFACHRAESFGELGKLAFGPKGRYFTELCIILFLIGAQVSYLSVIGELLTPLLVDWGVTGMDNPSLQKLVSAIIAVVIIFPISSLRRMDSLRFTSFIALFFIFCLLVSVLVVSSRKLASGGIKSEEFSWHGRGFQGIFVSLPILNFAFTFHPNIPGVWKELEDQSPRNINLICMISIAICATFYITLGLFGYLYYYLDTPPNILSGFEGDPLFTAIKFGYTLVIVFSYPVLNFATRNGIDSLLFSPSTIAPWWRYVIESATIIIITYVISILVPSIDVIFGFTGATFGQLVIFINPALFLYISI